MGELRPATIRWGVIGLAAAALSAFTAGVAETLSTGLASTAVLCLLVAFCRFADEYQP